MTSTEELERPAWGVWVDYKIAPPGSYACLVSRFMDNRWTDPEPQWMPAQLRPQLHGEVRVMPYLMPNDPLAAVNALPELVERVKRLEAELAKERERRVEVDGWQPIETPPKDGTRVLVWSVPIANYYNADEPPHVAIAYWLERRPNEIRMGFHSGWVWHGMAGCTFTHWRPLPTPPATTQHEDTP